MGSLHPILIHFPIVLLLAAVAIEAVAFFDDDPRLRWAGRLALLFGMVSTLFAFVCGNFAEIWAARSGISQQALEYHELLATITSWSFVGLTGWRLLMRDGENPTPRVWRGVWLAAAAAACVALVYTGYHGGVLVYKHAAAVQGIGLQRVPTHEDLFTLSQRQDMDSIFYSNMMHHVFGWMVLLLSALLLFQQFAPRMAGQLRQIGPAALLAGGVLLLVFSDQDAWPLYHVRPFRPIFDKEVVLHKTYSALMLVIGLHGVWQILRSRFWRGGQLSDSGAGWKVHDRIMAVFALVGGALLFTHVHSAAPYANVACGVYIHHTTMGFVALCIGAVKLADDSRMTVSFARRMAYPALMCLEAILLINYNEGLPWFMGYGRFSEQAAHGGIVAPLGPHRAELVYHPDTTRLEMFVQEPDSGKRVFLPIQTATAIVRLGDDATQVDLPANPGGESSSAHFAGEAPFLRGAAMFTVQARVSLDGREYTADFEPWIDPALTGHSKAKWVCPMHPNVGSDTAKQRCKVCGMALELLARNRPAGQLHDPEFQVDLTTNPTPTPGHRTRLTFALKRVAKNQIVRNLEVVHTKKLHLIVASADLSFFDHVHPDEQADGTYAMEYTFPMGGDYALFADLMPVGAPNQVFRLPVRVAGPASAVQPLHESLAPTRMFGRYRIGLSTSPFPLQANDDVTLTFTLDENNRPVMDLDPYLGASGHCVILSQDSREYLHSHPVDMPGRSVNGPQVTFHTRFPRSGLYKVWGQFQRQGHIIVADFVLRMP